MKISIIVVSYNEADYLAECLDSCIRNLRAFPEPGDCEILMTVPTTALRRSSGPIRRNIPT